MQNWDYVEEVNCSIRLQWELNLIVPNDQITTTENSRQILCAMPVGQKALQ